jgi:hypothetical protein
MPHRFAMKEAPIVRYRLQRVSNCMAKIQNSAQPVFALVATNYGGLDLAGARDQRYKSLEVDLP